MKKALFRIIILLLATVSLFSMSCAETDDEDEWEEELDEYEEWYRNATDEEIFEEDFGSLCSLDGDTLIIRDGLITLGLYNGEYTLGNWDKRTEDPEVAALFGSCRDENRTIDTDGINHFETDFTFSGVKWPVSLRMLGDSSFMYLMCKTITFPSSLERIYPGAFYRCTFGKVRIENCLQQDDLVRCFDECWIDAYEVPEDHPLYKTVDGVLYTKDGKKLLAYPNARKDEHFDVPAGVECIGGYAFSGVGDENEHLKTVSLPIGLKTLNDYAFSGCTRLQSIAVPLTVEHIGKDVFDDCVSLERVSLPEGLEADKNDDWCIYYPEDNLFRGDNGDTLPQPRKDEDY